ncbi:MAG TPA: hypothetical protein VHQ67_01760 [Nitrospiraceae bacterium]|jgi:hypothetical protein|nr:hypothetical protein [Nitrospiraceae bacterium]
MTCGLRSIVLLVRHHCLIFVGAALFMSLQWPGSPPWTAGATEPGGPRGNKMTCGKCPDGYAITGTTIDTKICPEGDHAVVQCEPLGTNILSVCGACPDGYTEIGSSSLPSRCGTLDGGRASQCQLKTMETNLPDPAQGGVVCPPNCGSSATPGQGGLPPPPKYRPAPEKKAE